MNNTTMIEPGQTWVDNITKKVYTVIYSDVKAPGGIVKQWGLLSKHCLIPVKTGGLTRGSFWSPKPDLQEWLSENATATPTYRGES